jgi:hypothetical protein
MDSNRYNLRLFLLKYFLILFFILGFFVYFQSLSNPFVLDDEEQIVLNPLVHSVHNIETIFKGSTMNSGDNETSTGIYYKPIMSVVYSVLWDFFGNNPFPFHFVQLSLHVINSFLIFLFFLNFLNLPVSLGFALIFLVHPINSENVLYCANLQDVLYMFFGLIATLLTLKNLREKESQFKYRFIVGCSLLLSLLSKETGILFSFVVGLIHWMTNSDKKLEKKIRKIIEEYSHLIIPIVIYFYLRLAVAHLVSITPPIVKIGQLDLWGRLRSLPEIVMYYVSLIFYPIPITLVQDWVVSDITWSNFFKPFFLVITLMSLGFWSIKKIILPKHKKSATFFLILLVLGLGLHSQILPLDGTVAARWFYFPMIGFFGLGALTLESLMERFSVLQIRKYQILLLIIFIIKISGLSWLSYERSLEWKSALTLYQIEAERQPDLYFIQNNLGVELFRKGNLLEAHQRFQKAVELAPLWTVAWNNLGSSWQAQGNLDEAEQCYLKSMALSSYYMAYENYAVLLYKRKKIDLLKVFLGTPSATQFRGNNILSQLKQLVDQEIISN